MINPMDLSGRTILVTGASSGIGRETALLLSRLGARVVLVARNAERLNEVMHGLEGSGHSAELFDLMAVDEIPAWMKKICANSGRLNGVVHSAGAQLMRPIQITRAEDVESVMRVNTTAAFGLARGLCQKDVLGDSASIVLISSAAGLTGQPGRTAYAASKGAVMALVRALAIELARQKIRVNCVAPAVVESEMSEQIRAAVTEEQFASIVAQHPLGLGTTLDVAHAIAFLLAGTGRWITGSTLIVDGGYTAQ